MDIDKLINNYSKRIQRNGSGQWVLGDTPDLWFYDEELTEDQKNLIVEHNEIYPIQIQKNEQDDASTPIKKHFYPLLG